MSRLSYFKMGIEFCFEKFISLLNYVISPHGNSIKINNYWHFIPIKVNVDGCTPNKIWNIIPSINHKIVVRTSGILVVRLVTIAAIMVNK